MLLLIRLANMENQHFDSIKTDQAAEVEHILTLMAILAILLSANIHINIDYEQCSKPQKFPFSSGFSTGFSSMFVPSQ